MRTLATDNKVFIGINSPFVFLTHRENGDGLYLLAPSPDVSRKKIRVREGARAHSVLK